MWRKELTGNSYGHPGDVQWGQFVTKDYRRDRDGGNFLRNTGDGHGNYPCPFDDTGLLQGR